MKADTDSAIPCFRCGECCRRYQVRLDTAEAQRIAGELNLTLEDFRDKYADRRWPSETSLLLRQDGGACPFLESSRESGEMICAIHSFKPLNCREWMPSLYRRECQSGIARHWGIAVNSSGELEGPDDKIREFLLYLDLLASDRRS